MQNAELHGLDDRPPRLDNRDLAEQKLQANERTLRLFVEYAPAAIAIFDREMRYLAVSRRFVEVCRPAIPELIGRTYYEAFPEMPPHWAEVHQRCLTGATDYVAQEPFLRRDGTLEWVHWEIRPWYDETGAIGGIILFSETITDRVLSQAALRESEERYRLLFETMNKGVLFLESDGRLAHANPAAEAILGLPAAELAQRTHAEPFWQPIHADGTPFPPAEHPSAVALRTGQPVHDVVMGVVNQQDGSYRWLSISAVPRFKPGRPEPFQVYVTFEDITQHLAAQHALRQSEEKYRGLVASLAGLVIVVDAAGRFLYVNDLAAAELGATPPDLLGRGAGELLDPDMTAALMVSVAQTLRTNRPATAELQTTVRDMPRWYRLSLQPLHDARGSAASVLIHATDVYDLKHAQQELEALNRTLEARVHARAAEVEDLYEHAPNGYHSLDAQGHIVRINQTELAWLGYTREELLGRPLLQVLTPHSQAVFQVTFPHFLATGHLRDLEMDFVRKDGSTLSVVANATAVYDEQGNYLMSRSTIFDDTERKQAADALRRANAELAQAARLKDEFLATMSHELRTPLTGILGLNENLQEEIYGPLTERQRKALGYVEASGRHLLALINDLLDLSKIEAGKFQLDLEPVAVEDACQGSLQFIEEAAHKKNLQLTYRNELPGAVLRADARRLKQMLGNLLGNAVKFTPAGGAVELHVTAAPGREAGHARILFAVQDTGPGIAPADLPKLFQPFTQLDAALARRHEGTGLGLAMVKRLTEQHGGEVTVTSAGTPGQGSRFTIALPYTAAPTAVT